MAALNIFECSGWNRIASYLAPDTLFAFDLDGTLAPIVEEFSAARIDPQVLGLLERLRRLARVAVITGRSRNDALTLLGDVAHLVVGNHGSDWPGELRPRNWEFVARCLAWRDQLGRELFYLPGVEIEFKGETLSIHYRKSPDPEGALAEISDRIAGLAPPPRSVGGKFVVNLVPREAGDKGDALLTAMQLLGTPRAVYLGDDTTDEDVFKLRQVPLLGIRIGFDAHSAAPFFLEHQSEVPVLLIALVQALEAAVSTR